MPTGTIARLLIDKGFGFIRDESGIEHFFHRSSVRGAVFELLREGQRVEFAPGKCGSSRADRRRIRRGAVAPPPLAIPDPHDPAPILQSLMEANRARWPSRSSKPVAARVIASGLGSTPRRFRQLCR